MNKKDKFPKYWCYSENYGIGGVVRTYRIYSRPKNAG